MYWAYLPQSHYPGFTDSGKNTSIATYISYTNGYWWLKYEVVLINWKNISSQNNKIILISLYTNTHGCYCSIINSLESNLMNRLQNRILLIKTFPMIHHMICLKTGTVPPNSFLCENNLGNVYLFIIRKVFVSMEQTYISIHGIFMFQFTFKNGCYQGHLF